MIAAWRRWQRRRRCFHGDPVSLTRTGRSFVVALVHVDQGRKLYECMTEAGGCGRRWVL